MTDQMTKKMDAKRLEQVARYLFPNSGRSWKLKVAKQMNIHVTTVRRWVLKDCVPQGFDLALECMAARKQDILKQQNGKQ